MKKKEEAFLSIRITKFSFKLNSVVRRLIGKNEVEKKRKKRTNVL